MGNQIDTFSAILPYQAIATFSRFNCAQERRKHFKPHFLSQNLLFYASQKFPKCETLSGTRKPLRGVGEIQSTPVLVMLALKVIWQWKSKPILWNATGSNIPTDGITQKALEIFLGGLSVTNTDDTSSFFATSPPTYRPSLHWSIAERNLRNRSNYLHL